MVTIFSWKEPIITEYYSRWNIGLYMHTVVGRLQCFLRKDVSVTGTNCMAPDITGEAEPKSQELHRFTSVLLSTWKQIIRPSFEMCPAYGIRKKERKNSKTTVPLKTQYSGESEQTGPVMSPPSLNLEPLDHVTFDWACSMICTSSSYLTLKTHVFLSH